MKQRYRSWLRDSEIVPTLQRGNAASDAPASRQAEPSNIVVSRSQGHRGKMGRLRLTGGSSTGRWSVGTIKLQAHSKRGTLEENQ